MVRAAVFAALACLSCSPLEVLEVGMCGNGVWEPEAQEDCDTNAIRGTCGDAGTPGACRFICNIDEECPGGRQCGRDHICRQPDRRFAAIDGSPYTTIGERFTSADIDGDSFRDIVGTNQRGGVLLFGTGDGSFEDRRTLITGRPLGPLVTAQLAEPMMDDDMTPPRDIVAPIGRGLQITRVDEDRKLKPVAHAFDVANLTNGNAAEAVPLRIFGTTDVILQISEEPNGLLITPRVPERVATIPTQALDGATLDDIVGRPATGDIDPPSPRGTDEIAVALAGEPVIRIFGLRCPQMRCTWEARQTIMTEPVTEGIAFADANGDGVDDLFLGIGERLYIRLNDGSGTFGAPIEDRRVVRECSACAGWPLAIADLDDDGLADFVTAHGIATTSSSGATLRHRPPRSQIRTWSYGVVGDFDGDGKKDVALASDGEIGFEIALGSDNLLFNTFFRETSRDAHGLAAADFDGDGIDDLAIIEGVTNAAVTIAYGAPREPPLAPIEMARFDRIERIAPGLITGLGLEMIDFRADLLVEATRMDDQPADELALLVGTQDRQMVAPAVLGTKLEDEERPKGVIAGTFDTTFDGDDLVALSNEAVWLFPSKQNGALDTTAAVRTPTTIVGMTQALATRAQLDGDDFDEIVVVTTEPVMYILDLDTSGTFEVTEVGLSANGLAPTSVTVVDADQSDKPVIVVTFSGLTSQVTIFRTNGGARIEGSPTTLALGADVFALSAAAANIDEDANVEILLLTQDTVRSLELEEGAWTLSPAVVPLAGDRPPSTSGSIGTADFDDDGLVDLAIANDAGFFVYRSLEKVGEVMEGAEP